jgi:hypothetical protein
MALSNHVKDAQFAVSAFNAEDSLNAGSALDLSLGVAEGDLPSLEYTRETNKAEIKSGKRGADYIYNKGKTGSGSMTFEKVKAHELAFALAYGLGQSTVVAAGTGWAHTFTCRTDDMEKNRSLPSFSLAHRFSEVLDRKFDGCLADGFTLTVTKGEFLKLALPYKATGKVTDSVYEESVTADDDATSISLSSGVFGTTAAQRLANVHRIVAEDAADPDIKRNVVITSVSDSTSAAVITVEPPGNAGTSVDWAVLFTKYGGKQTFPARMTESPLKAVDTKIYVGGKWDGSAFQGGWLLDCDLESAEITCANAHEIKQCIGSGVEYGSTAITGDVAFTAKLNLAFRDMTWQNNLTKDTGFGLYIKCEGAIYDDPHKFTAEFIMPLCFLKTDPISLNGKRYAEALDIEIGQATGYGEMIAVVKTLAQAMAQ